MSDLAATLKMFHSTPPRLFPHQDFQRPIIEGLLAQLAAVDPASYEERLEKYNAMCDQLQCPRFPRVTITREEVQPEPKVEVEVEAVQIEEPVVQEEATEAEEVEAPAAAVVEQPKKKRGRKPSSPSTDA